MTKNLSKWLDENIGSDTPRSSDTKNTHQSSRSFANAQKKKHAQHSRKSSQSQSSRGSQKSQNSRGSRHSDKSKHARHEKRSMSRSRNNSRQGTTSRTQHHTKYNTASKTLRIIPFGGLEQVGINCMALEYGNDIIIVDAGLQFAEHDMPGIDYIIPDTTYLKGKEKNIRGIFITHGHMDHIGAIPQLSKILGSKIPIFSAKLTIAFIKKRQEEYRTKLNLHTFNPDKDVLKMGAFTIEPFRINHTIPDACGFFIRTPVGNIVHTGDWKFDHSPMSGEEPVDFGRLASFGNQGVLALLTDSTNAHLPGFQLSETSISDQLESIFRTAKGRIITGTFASLISRLQQIINLSEKYQRKVLIDGRSMKSNLAIAKQLGYIKYKESTLIDYKKLSKYKPSEITIMCTGAQGEEYAALNRIATGNHKHLSIHPGDTVVFSSSVVPGNERPVQHLFDLLYQQEAIVFHKNIMDIHAGGHAKQEDIKVMIKLIRPEYFVPIYGSRFQLTHNAQTAEKLGYDKSHILIGNNSCIFEFSSDRHSKNLGKIIYDREPHKLVTVDGLSVGEIGDVVLADRKHMSEGGIFVIIVTTDKKNKLLKSPDIISRGFIYMRESEKLISKTRDLVTQLYKKSSPTDQRDMRQTIRKKVESYLVKETGREPVVLPVIVTI